MPSMPDFCLKLWHLVQEAYLAHHSWGLQIVERDKNNNFVAKFLAEKWISGSSSTTTPKLGVKYSKNLHFSKSLRLNRFLGSVVTYWIGVHTMLDLFSY